MSDTNNKLIEGTRAAFAALLSQRGIYKQLGIDRRTVASYKNRLNKGESISLDKMEEVLTNAGAIVERDKVWRLKS